MKMEFSLAKDTDERNLDSDGRVAEVKYDGVRIGYLNTGNRPLLKSRSGNTKNQQFQELMEVDIPEDTILDGEVIVEKPAGTFSSKLMKRNNTQDEFRQKVMSRKIPVTFVVFDITRLRGKDLTDLPYHKRREKVEEVVGNIESERLEVSKKFEDVEEGWNYANRKGLEGVIVKKKDAKYVEGRSDVWKKYKTFEEKQLVAVEYEEHNKGVTVETEAGHRLTVNGHGEAEKVATTIEKKGMAKIDVGFLEETDDGSLRHPTYRGLEV